MPIANTCSIGYPHDSRADYAAYRHDRRADNAAYRHDRRADSLSHPHDIRLNKTTDSSFPIHNEVLCCNEFNSNLSHIAFNQ